MLKLDCQHICTYFQRMARKFNQDFVMDLPYREKLEIFLQLSGEDLVSCRSVSSAWKSYINNMFQKRGLRSILSHHGLCNFSIHSYSLQDLVLTTGGKSPAFHDRASP